MSRPSAGALFLLAGLLCFSGTCREGPRRERGGRATGAFEAERAFGHAEELVKIGGRHPTSTGNAEARNYIARTIEASKLGVRRQPFE
ncbi:MAG: hypothetical protein ACRD1Z_15020, partial [Vicinamibacteria bacterium]